MNRHSPRILALIALLVVPGVVAFEPGTDVRQYLGFVLTESNADGVIDEREVSVARPHTWETVHGESILEIQISLVTQAGGAVNPTAEFEAIWDGDAVDNCNWHVEGGTITGGRFNPSISLYCILPAFAEEGNHTIEIRRTEVTGTPITDATTSIVLHQREEIMHPITDFEAATGLTALEFLFFIGLAIVGVFLWSRRRDLAVRALGSLLIIMDAVLMSVVGFLTFQSNSGLLFAFALVFLVFGTYSLIRAFIDFGKNQRGLGL